MDLLTLSLLLAKILLIYLAMIHVVPVMIWVERKGAALIQDRPGPNRVGPFGLLQPVADAVKFLFKEDPIPNEVNRFLYVAAPFMALIPASLAIAALPFGDTVVAFGRTLKLQVADLNVGILYILGIGSLGIYGVLFGGWASNNKFSLYGAMRSSSQMISYEIPLGLAAANAVLLFGTFSLREMVLLQEGTLWGVLPNWGIFYQPLGFLIFFISIFAETNRLPFDLPEAEAELVAGYHTEYGSMKFATFFMAEYIAMATASGMMTTMYLGGWHLPWITDGELLAYLGGEGARNWLAVIQVLTFFAKLSFFMLVFVWIRWTLPRFRFDQLMRLTWRNLIPLSIINIFVTAVLLFVFEGA